MFDSVYDWGYVGLFLISFLAATLVPISPEALVIALYTQQYNAFMLIAVATIGGYLGSLTYYYLAISGRKWALNRFIKISPEKLATNQARFERWGSIILLFSWVPIVGEPLIVVSGFMRVRLAIFSFWVILGRIFRFSLLLLITDNII